jgi:hypothetical protein
MQTPTKFLSNAELKEREDWERHAPNAFRQPDEEVLAMIAEIRGYRAVDKWLQEEDNKPFPTDHLPEGAH